MKNQVGARFMARKNREQVKPEAVITNHIKRESELIRLESGAVRRKSNRDT
jgi:hypothetical protein